MEYRILTLFVRYPNTFFTANELYQKIWGKDSLGDVRTVQVHIHNLRSKIEPDPAKPVYLKMSGERDTSSSRRGRGLKNRLNESADFLRKLKQSALFCGLLSK